MIGLFVEDFPSIRRGICIRGQYERTGRESRNIYAALVRKNERVGGKGETRSKRRTGQCKPKTKHLQQSKARKKQRRL